MTIVTHQPIAVTAQTAASQSLRHAAEFLTMASDLIRDGAPSDSPEVARWVDFGKRKVWQGEEELAGRVFAFDP